MDEIDRISEQVDQMREDLNHERKRVRSAEGVAYSLRSNIDFVQSLIDSVQRVFVRIADDDDTLNIQMKSKRKCQATETFSNKKAKTTETFV